MASSQDATDVLEVLKQSLIAEDYGDIVGDRFFDEPLLRKGPKSTPEEAFDATGLLVGPTVIVTAPPSVPTLQDMDVVNAVDDHYTFWLYGQDTPGNWSYLAFLIRYIRSLFRGADVYFTRGEYGFFEWTGGLQIRRNHEEFQGSINANVRFKCTYVESRLVERHSALESA